MSSQGTLVFTSELDNSKLNKGLDEAKERLKNSAKDTSQALRDTQANLSGATKENISIQKQVIKEMEQAYKDLQKQIQKTAPGQGQQTLMREANSLKASIDEERKALAMLEEQVEQADNAHISLRSQIKALREEMATLIVNGVSESSEEYRALADELGRLQDIQGDIQAQGSVLANDEAKFQATLSGLQGIAGGFGAVTGAMALFGAKNDAVEQSMQKLMATMQLVQGVQAVAQALNKDSAFRLVILRGFQEAYAKANAVSAVSTTTDTTAKVANTVATTANSVAQGGNNASKTAGVTANTASATATTADTTAKVANTAVTATTTAANYTLIGVLRTLWATMLSNPFTAILAGVGAIILAIYKLTESSREAEAAQQALNEKIIESASEPVGSILRLSQEFSALGDNVKAKEKFVRDNAKAFDALGVSIRSVADAERILINQKDAFIQAQIAKAKASAILESDAYKEAMKKVVNAEVKMPEAEMWVKKAQERDRAKKAEDSLLPTSTHAEAYEAYHNLNTLKREASEGNKELERLTSKVIDLNAEYNKTMNDLNAPNKGSVMERRKQLEDDIENNKRQYEGLQASDKAGQKKLIAEREKLQRELDALEGKSESKKTKSSGGKSDKDPYREMLDKRKAQYDTYLKMINSGDAEATEYARRHFADLIKGGSTYLEYLKSQREALNKAPSSADKDHKLSTLNALISEESEKSITDKYKERIEKELSRADDAISKLLVIQEERKKLQESDYDAPLKEMMNKSLIDAEKSALDEIDKAQTEAEKKYKEHLNAKLSDTQRYILERERLTKAQAEASDEPTKQAIAKQLSTLDTNYKTSQGSEYEKMRKEYATFQEELTRIHQEYEEKRAIAQLNNNTAMLQELDRAERKEISSKALSEIQSNPLYEKLFGNLDDVASSEIEKLIALIEDAPLQLGIELSPKDLETLKGKLDTAKNTLRERNPFKALVQGVKEYSKASTDAERRDAIKHIATSATSSLDTVGSAVGSVKEGLSTLGVDMSGTLGDIVGGLQSAIGSASQLAKGIATGNPLDMIQGGIGLVTTAFSMFGDTDAKAEKRIQAHQKEVKRLEQAYKDLEDVVSDALGGEQYTYADDQIRNLTAQQQQYNAMKREEAGKKKSDSEKIDEYTQKVKDLEKQKAEVVKALQEDLMTTSAKSAAEDLGTAFVDAFAKGENAVSAFKTKVNDLVSSIMKQMIIKQLFEKPIGSILDKYSKRWVDNQGNFAGFDRMEGDIDSLSKELNTVTDGISQHGKSLLEKLTNFSTGEASSSGSISADVKTVTEETAKVLEGQINAIRITGENAQTARLAMSEHLRSLLSTLTSIKGDTAHLHYLEKIHSKLDTSQAKERQTAPQGTALDGSTRSLGA